MAYCESPQWYADRSDLAVRRGRDLNQKTVHGGRPCCCLWAYFESEKYQGDVNQIQPRCPQFVDSLQISILGRDFKNIRVNFSKYLARTVAVI